MSIFDNILEPIYPKWEDFKTELDKYPNAFNLKYDSEKGYCLVIDFDVVIQLQEIQDS